MKKFKLICATLLLALSLSTPVLADDNDPGDSHTPGKPNPIQAEPGTESSGATDEAGALVNIDGLTIVDILWAMAFFR